MQINIIIVNDMCQLDTTGAFEVLVRIPGWTVSTSSRRRWSRCEPIAA